MLTSFLDAGFGAGDPVRPIQERDLGPTLYSDRRLGHRYGSISHIFYKIHDSSMARLAKTLKVFLNAVHVIDVRSARVLSIES